MRETDRSPRRAALALLLALGCARNRAPEALLLSPGEAQHTARGSFISVQVWTGRGADLAVAAGVTMETPAEPLLFEGELLAALPDRLYVRVERVARAGSGAAWTVTPRPLLIGAADIQSARLEEYATQKNWLVDWTLLGTLSTASHGVLLIASAPVWIVGGSIASAVESRSANLEVEKRESLLVLAPWARFPQGLVPGLEEGKVGRGPSK